MKNLSQVSLFCSPNTISVLQCGILERCQYCRRSSSFFNGFKVQTYQVISKISKGEDVIIGGEKGEVNVKGGDQSPLPIMK